MRHFFEDSQLNFLVVVNVLIALLAVTLTGASFVDSYNLQSMAGQVPELGFLAIGVMLAMISGNGGIDLSGIALANLSAVIASSVAPHLAEPATSPLLFTAMFAGVAITVGAVGGCINGILISYAKLPAILCTLGTQLLFTGVAVVWSAGSAVRIGQIESLAYIGNGLVFGVPLCFVLYMGVSVAIGVWLARGPSGVRLYLLGTNLKAARYSGIAHQKIVASIYVTSGILASIAGIIIVSRSSSAKWDYGGSYVLIAILIAVMAGVRPEGGYGRMTCVVLSAIALQLMSSTLNFLEVSSFFRDFAWGALLLLFVASSKIKLRKI